jgi:ABC-type Fe3+/spermidine/putrescine transport system ATPase subunit
MQMRTMLIHALSSSHVPELESVSVRYARQVPQRAAVERVSLGLRPGQIGVLIGPSGCGKTSLLRAVAGLERCAAGRVSIAGQTLSTPPPASTWRPSSATSAWCSRTTRCFRT